MKRSKNGKNVDRQIFEMQSQICRAFANPIRLEILHLLGRHEWAASDLQSTLGITKANLSQHLTVLRTAGVIVTRREGNRVYCSLAISEVKQACQLIHGVLLRQIRETRKLAS
jgi:ArsR family transcriptional regulator